MTQTELFEFLDSDNNTYGLDYIATHGFLCASIVGPKLPNWQTVLFDSEQESVPIEVLTAIEAWRESIANEIKDNESIELPLTEEDEVTLSVESELGDWCVGFIEAMYANEQADWFELASEYDSDEDDIAALTLPMVIFSGIEEDDDDLKTMRKNQSLMEDMADSIEKNVLELYLIFQMPKEQ